MSEGGMRSKPTERDECFLQKRKADKVKKKRVVEFLNPTFAPNASRLLILIHGKS